mgnify:FL=1|tara:strand:- start:187 stop:537 length:351 start_codon:yes stop_codon:yes gene_type:complete
MNWKDVQSAQKSLGKNDGVTMETDNRVALEAITVGMLAGGRVQEFGIGMQALEKVNTQLALSEVLKGVGEVLNDIKAQRVATAPAPTEADKAPEWAKALIAGQRDFNERLKALEKR